MILNNVNNNVNTQLEVIDQREVLGKQFRIYGTKENPLFLAKDVAEWIEHKNMTHMMNIVDEDEKLTYTISNSGQGREMWFLTEDGLYEVLMQSRKPIAKEFKKQIKIILKSIRQNGMYVKDELLDNPDLLLEVVTKLKFEREVRLKIERENLLLEQKNLRQAEQLFIQTPKAEYFDKHLDTKNLMNITIIAKDLGVTATKLNNILVEHKVMFKSGNVYVPYSKYHFLIEEGCLGYKKEIDRNNKARQRIQWSEKGRHWIINFLEKNNIAF